jgi:pyruvate dehydrogenase E1 component beta subunit
MYGIEFEVDESIMDKEWTQPIGEAKIMREGTDVTIVSYSKMVGESLKAADTLAEQGISAEVINLRTIRPLDRATIVNSVKKTNRLVSVEDGYPQHGVGAEICALAFESLFDELDAPVERVTAWDVPLPYARNLEAGALPQPNHIVDAVNGLF